MKEEKEGEEEGLRRPGKTLAYEKV